MQTGHGVGTGAELASAAFSDLPGFDDDDLSEAWKVFFKSCEAIERNTPELRKGAPQVPGQRAVARRALSCGPELTIEEARRFFRSNFRPYLIGAPTSSTDRPAFFTAYYRPEVAGSLSISPEFSEPLLARPQDLVTLPPGDDIPSLRGLSAARQRADGALEPYPTRAQIDAGALGEISRPVVYVADAIEAFMIHVQGSARVTLPDGRRLNLTYAGRNGRPYTSIGKVLIESGEIPPADMSLESLKTWVRSHGQGPGQSGRALLHKNESFVFFSASFNERDWEGPIGAAGLPLSANRSIAVDRSLWPYGLPFWADVTVPWKEARETSFSRMVVAQDTGSAIIGPGRADIFFGTGAQAGYLAGSVRHHGRMFVLLPVDESP